MTVRSFLSVAAVATMLASPLACSSDDGGSTGPKYTVDNVCAQTITKVCAARKGCCDKARFAYEAAGCETYEKSQCELNVAEVKAGTMTFDGTNVDTCLTKYQQLLDKCYVSFDEITTFIADLKICQIFVGKVAVGGPCTRTAQCAPTAATNEQVACTNSKCVLTKLLPEGSACSYAMGNTEFCQSGTYCDADFTKMPPTGICKKSFAVGESCMGKPFACGLGSYCDSMTTKCTAGKAVGAMCANDLECKSLSCDGMAKTCTAGDPLVDAKECNGK